MKQKCPYCLAHLDGSINVPSPDDVVEHIEVTPNPGDFSVCFCCGEISKYGQDKLLCKLTNDDLQELETLPELLNTLSLIENKIKNKNISNLN